MPATTAVSWSLLRTFSSPPVVCTDRRVLRRKPPLGSEPGERRDLVAVGDAVAVRVGVRLAALEEEVQVVLPGEADAAVDLQCRTRDSATGIARVRLRARDRQWRGLRLVVERPCRPVDGRSRALDLEHHLRAGVRDGLVGPDPAVELLALLRVLDRHAPRPLGEA